MTRRRSIVRLVVAAMPEFVWKYVYPNSPQIFYNPAFLSKMQHKYCDTRPMDQSNASFSSFKSFLDLSCKKPDLLRISTPKTKLHSQDAKLSALEMELTEIRKQIARIMQQQQYCEPFPSSGYESLSNVSPKDNKESIPPPPPPPMPPPMPPPTFQSTPCLTGIKKQVEKVQGKSAFGFPSGTELLRDLGMVKLRKVEKSPGGGPKKQKKSHVDPGDFLQEVLRKRFGVIQDLTPDSSRQSSIDPDDPFRDELVKPSQLVCSMPVEV